jgi:hypothetical protein
MRTAFDFAVNPIRPDSHVVRVYNDGLTGLLYDLAAEEALRDAAPQILFGAGSHLFDDAATRTALASGELLAYGMHGDSEIAVEVVVGAPLTEQELADGRWWQSGPCHIALPSGCLCIHSYNSLPIGDFEPDPMTPGGVVHVPPGRYHVRMYRKDWPAMLDAGTAGDDAVDQWQLAEEAIGDVLVLTPFVSGESVPAVHNVLFAECIGFAEAVSA